MVNKADRFAAEKNPAGAAASRRLVAAYFFAAAAAALTLVLRLQLSGWVGDRPFLVLFFIPIIFSAYWGGLGPGLVAVCITAVGSEYYLLPPTHSFLFEKPVDFVQWLLFIISGGLASGLCEMLHRARRAADANWNLYAVTLASIGDAVITTDELGRVNFLNAEAEKLTGWKNAEASGKELAEIFRIINEKTRATVESPVAKVFRTGMVVGLANHTVLIAKDGSERIIDDSGAPIRTADGKTVGVVLVFRDNTEKKRAEDALRMSEEKFARAFASNPAAIALTLLNDGLVLEVNDTWTELCGFSREEIVGHSARSMWPREDDLKKFLHDLRANGLVRGWEQEFKKKSGEIFTAKLWSQVLEFKGRQVLLSTLVDITAQKQAEAERAKLAAIVQNSQDAIISKTLDGVITSWNRGAEKIFGFTADEALGRPLLIIFPAEKLHEEQRILEKISRGETVEHFETVRIRKDGRQINVSATISPVRDANGKITGASNISRDITEKMRLQEQLRQSQKMEAIGQLSAGVAHDFNNLLTAIHGNASLLADATAEERAECAGEILAAANRAAELTRQLLLFSRKQAMRFTRLDLNATVASTGKMLRRLLGENITLHSEHAPNLPAIRADAGMIDQIIFNLAVNAQDAMQGRNGTLTIRTSAASARNPGDEKSAPQNCACLAVSDTGHGIPPEILPRIFEPFFTTKEVGKGTGLGLATIYGIVKQHGGWIAVESEVGRGTAFKIYFPALAETFHEPAAETVFKHLPRGTETILVVEDEAPVRKFLGNFLERLGYKILAAESGVAALELWPREREKISLVLTDLVMPHGVRGYDLADQLLADRPAVKIVFTSGYASDTEPRRAMLVEGVNFIRKPFKPEALAEIIRRNLDEKIS